MTCIPFEAVTAEGTTVRGIACTRTRKPRCGVCSKAARARKARAKHADRFDGATFDQQADGERLAVQLGRVQTLMEDGVWRTLAEVAALVGSPEASVSARLRDLRKERFGGWHVERRRRADAGGLHEYRVSPDAAVRPATHACDVCGVLVCKRHRHTDARGDVCPACYARPALPFGAVPGTPSSTAPVTRKGG